MRFRALIVMIIGLCIGVYLGGGMAGSAEAQSGEKSAGRREAREKKDGQKTGERREERAERREAKPKDERDKKGKDKDKKDKDEKGDKKDKGKKDKDGKDGQKKESAPKPSSSKPPVSGKAPVAEAPAVSSGGEGSTDLLPAAFRKGLAARNDQKACLAQVPKVQPTDMRHLLEGLCHQASNHDDRAIESFSKALKARGSNSDAAFFTGMSFMKKEEYPKARAAFEEALWFGKMKVATIEEAHYRMAQTYLAEDVKDKAEKALNAAIAENGDYAPAKIELAELRMANGNKTPALNLLREALSAAPEDRRLRQRLVETLLNRKTRPPTPAEALEAKGHAALLIEGLEGKAKYESEAFPLYARALIEAGELEEARRDITSALQLHPEHAEIQRLHRQLAISEQSRDDDDRRGGAKEKDKEKDDGSESEPEPE